MDMRRVVEEAIELYNRYRSPEAVASLVDVKGSVVVIEFRGSFCHTCGVVDWIEDMKYVMEDLGLEAEIIDIVSTGLDRMVAFFEVRPRGSSIGSGIFLASEPPYRARQRFS